MHNFILINIIAFLQVFQSAVGLKCYECNSIIDFCDEQHLGREVTCPATATACFTLKDADWTETFSRGCTAKDVPYWTRSILDCKEVPGVGLYHKYKGERCLCNGDLCNKVNSSQNLTTNSALILMIVTINSMLFFINDL